LAVAVNAWQAALGPHAFLGIDRRGEVGIVRTRGNPDGHVILRGGPQPNYDAASLAAAAAALAGAGLPTRLVVDCSHGNSGKDPARQPEVLRAITPALCGQDAKVVPVLGAMLESNLQGGCQKLVAGVRPVRGVSVTDACIGWDETVAAVRALALALRQDPPQCARLGSA
jgi:3-deoxy-7-phosphoheptulonate synthase